MATNCGGIAHLAFEFQACGWADERLYGYPKQLLGLIEVIRHRSIHNSGRKFGRIPKAHSQLFHGHRQIHLGASPKKDIIHQCHLGTSFVVEYGTLSKVRTTAGVRGCLVGQQCVRKAMGQEPRLVFL